MSSRSASYFPLLLLYLSDCHSLSAQSSKPDLVLQGEVTAAQNKTYFEVPFDVPAGCTASASTSLTRARTSTPLLDLGVADPVRFRGNSGGNKSHFTISESDATPSYLPGAILPGKWKLLISVPNIRSAEHSPYRAEIRFNSPLEDQGFTLKPLNDHALVSRRPAHAYRATATAVVASQSGKIVPCPVFLTAQTRRRREVWTSSPSRTTTRLSQYDAMRELQPYFDQSC